MICTNCFEAEYKTAKTELTVIVNGESQVLRDLDCETCPACGEITFTHAQSLVIDKKRITLEFGLKPLLTPDQLKTLRRVLDMKLDEICDLLHIGRNTYGRWERGEVEITPSMNLLVHNLIEKVPTASANLALPQAKAPQRVTSPKAATAASKVLSYGRTRSDSKSAAESALAQRPSKGKK